MRIVELTMPLYEGMGYGNVYPQERPFEIRWLYPPEYGSSRAVYIMSNEPGTRLLLPSSRVERRDAPRLDEIDLRQFVMRDAAILDVPKGALEVVRAEDIDGA
ncbi:MAG: hypothetical protein HYU86_02405 [Chloroflexi bacterium]|nr:hypothetical protein [Chloroflexota bacterium]